MKQFQVKYTRSQDAWIPIYAFDANDAEHRLTQAITSTRRKMGLPFLMKGPDGQLYALTGMA